MKTHSSRSHKSKGPRVTFAIQEDNYDAHPLQENIQPNKDITYDSQKPKKSTTTSLASKFSKRWERSNEPSLHNYQYQQEPKIQPVSKEIPELSQDSESPISMKSYNYEVPSEIENSDDMSDDLPRAIMMNNDPTNKRAEAILQNINLLVNRVHEICDKK